MSLEGKVESYIKHEGWDISYDRGVIKSHWGQEYTVEYKDDLDCDDLLLGSTSYLENSIVLNNPCDNFHEGIVGDSNEEIMAHTLAHELGHTDTWLLTSALHFMILSGGIYKTVKKKEATPVIYGLLGVVGCVCVIDELIAEGAANMLHNVPFLKSAYLVAPDFIEMTKNFINS